MVLDELLFGIGWGGRIFFSREKGLENDVSGIDYNVVTVWKDSNGIPRGRDIIALLPEALIDRLFFSSGR